MDFAGAYGWHGNGGSYFLMDEKENISFGYT